MAVIDKEVAEKASQDKSKDSKNTANHGQNTNHDASQDVTSIQDIAERAFNSSYDAVGNVIKTASKAGVERAIADYKRELDTFERSFNRDFLQTIDAKAEPYQIGASALRLLAASGSVDNELVTLTEEEKALCDRNDKLHALEASGNITPDEAAELAQIQKQLDELGLLK